MKKKSNPSTPTVKAKGKSSGKRKRVKLTEREKALLQFICDQYTNVKIAKILGKSKRTIENGRGRLLKKTGVRNTAGLVMYAIVNKIVKPDKSLKA